MRSLKWALYFLVVLSGCVKASDITQPKVIACVGTPGNTVGGYRQQCQTAGATPTLYQCANAAGCSVAADWYAANGGSLPNPAGTPVFGSPIISNGTTNLYGTGVLINPTSTAATDTATLGPELTTSGTCSGTGWTGTYPNYVAPGTTAPLTCTGFTSGQFYQTVTTIGAGGSGAVTITIGGSQSASGASGTVTAGLKANGTSLTYTPVATYTGTIGISAKKITPISQFSETGKDSTGAVSTRFNWQGLASLNNDFGNGSGAYCTTCFGNTSNGSTGQMSMTTGSNNTNLGYAGQTSLTTGVGNSNSGYAGQFNLTTGSYNINNGFEGQFNMTTGAANSNVGYAGQTTMTSGAANSNVGFEGQYFMTSGAANTNVGYVGQYATTSASNNTNVGYAGQYTMTTGSNNTNVGFQGQELMTTGQDNTNVGLAGQSNITTGTNNTNNGYGGQMDLVNGTGNSNSGFEGQSFLTTGSYNSNVGYSGQTGLTTGSYNSSLGYQAGRFITGGSSPNQTSSYGIYVGANAMPKADGDQNEIVVGGDSTGGATGAGSNTGVFGTPRMTDGYAGGAAGAAKWHATDFVPSSSAPGISGCSSATIVGNDHYGVITAGGASCNAVLSFGYSALHGWSCQINNQTHPGATNTVGEVSSTINTATFAGVTVTSDLLNYNCGPY